VRGESANGTGVEGSSFGFNSDKTVTWRIPNQAFQLNGTYWTFNFPAAILQQVTDFSSTAPGVSTEYSAIVESNDWPEGIVIQSVIVEWIMANDEATSADRLRMYVERCRIDVSADPFVYSNASMNSGVEYLAWGDGTGGVTRVDTFTCDQNHQLTHGKGGTSNYRDLLRIGFRPTVTSFGDAIRGVVVVGKVKSVATLTGPWATP